MAQYLNILDLKNKKHSTLLAFIAIIGILGPIIIMNSMSPREFEDYMELHNNSAESIIQPFLIVGIISSIIWLIKFIGYRNYQKKL